MALFHRPQVSVSTARTSAKRTPKGFTLIEVLVVVAIIALLISILLPSLSRAREQARKVACMANMRTLSQANLFYCQANQDFFAFDAKYGGNMFEMMHGVRPKGDAA